MSFLLSKAVFLDRDGVVNQKAPEGEYIRTWEEIQILPGAAKAIASLNRAGYKVFIVTNQRGVATLKIKINDLLEIHERIQREFAQAGAVISQIYYCPHDLPANCRCRKPQPGMLQRAAREHNLDLRASWMVGDSITDVKAGENAGCRTILLTLDLSPKSLSTRVLIAESLESAVPLMLNGHDYQARFVQTQPLELSRSRSCEDV
jgi:D-glycero-D-manno-heptose 1,7-bisphosphate phosphatase